MSPVDTRTYLLCGYVHPLILGRALQDAPPLEDADPAADADAERIVSALGRQPVLRRDLQRLMLRAGQAGTRREREAVELGWVNLFYGVGMRTPGSAVEAGEVLRAARGLAARLRAFLMPEPDAVSPAPLVARALHG